MILSIVLRFPCCGLSWTCDLLGLEQLGKVELDRRSPDALNLNVIQAHDARGRPVHPRYLAPLLQGQGTRELVRAAALSELAEVCRRLLGQAEGDVPTTPELFENPQQALDAWLPLNGPIAGST